MTVDLSLSDLAASDLATRAKSYLESARAQAGQRAAQGIAGDEIACGLAAQADALVRALHAAALAGGRRSDAASAVAILATGGYGRSELCPHSDLDLLFLFPAGADAGAVQAMAESILYPLWDSRLAVGHAVRDVAGAVALARQDLSACTALLDARLVTGDAHLADALQEATWRALAAAGSNDFVRRLAQEVAERHARFGQTVYLLEPNVKSGEGGYRDLCVGLWAAKARFRVRDLAGLVTLGELPARRAAALAAAREFYLRVRTLAHLHARRRQDQLTFELQEAIAPRLYPDARALPGELRPAVAPAVEQMMRTYQLHAKTVHRETERLLERSMIPPPRAPVIHRIDGSFCTFNGRLQAHAADVFRERPSEMVRIFRAALDLGAELHGHTRDVIAEEAHRVTGDRQAGAEFLALLADPRDARSPSLLEEMHDLGLLAALMPEFAPCTGRVQHDLYHVFTVDQHSLYAVAHLKRLARGELAREAPLPTAALRALEHPLALCLGMLLHDVGKPLGKGHSEKGARLCAEITRRFDMAPEDARLAEFLVRKHLVMAHLSQRRDIHDMALVARFAAEMGRPEALRQLYLLTWADMSMVAPGNLTEWKSMLLNELYLRTLAYLSRGPDLAARDSSALTRRRRQQAARALGEDADAGPLGELFRGLPDRYFVVTTPLQIKLHVRMSRDRAASGRKLALRVAHHPRKGYSVVTVCADDSPGLLARLCGVFLAHRLDILAAQITSRARAQDAGEAIDVFYVRDRSLREGTAAARWAAVAADFTAVFEHGQAVEELIAARAARPSALPPRVTPAVLTEIEVDNEVSADYTVIDVYTQDRLGVLYSITKTLTALGLDVYFSKVGTEADRVADVFYVRDKESRAKITDAERLAEVKRALEGALGALA
ncbi:MAG TPA: [protein-PII] uridylyltransferase [Polyangia bacterium]|nr:[protein-PII] uridylyltransferase [Polyangia bacterium]